jgi:hypothetical protein
LRQRGNKYYGVTSVDNQQENCDGSFDAQTLWEEASSPRRMPLTDRNAKTVTKRRNHVDIQKYTLSCSETKQNPLGVNKERLKVDISKIAGLEQPKDNTLLETRRFETTELFQWKIDTSDRHNKQFLDVQIAEFLRLFLDDYPKSQYWPLLNCLHSNQVVEKIVVFRKRQTDGERIRTPEELDSFFFTLASLHVPLRELHLWNFRSEDLTVLTNGLSNSRRLEYIQLHLESGTIDENLAKALASLHGLISLELEVNESFPVALILESKSLLVLGIICNNFEFQAEHIVAMAQKLESNNVLTVLDIEPRIPTFCLRVLVHALRSNRTLETFQFSCEGVNQDGDSTLLEILNTLSVNKRLRVLWNHCYESLVISEAIKKKVLQVLLKNQTIEQFHVFCEDPNFMYKKNALLDRNIRNNKCIQFPLFFRGLASKGKL